MCLHSWHLSNVSATLPCPLGIPLCRHSHQPLKPSEVCSVVCCPSLVDLASSTPTLQPFLPSLLGLLSWFRHSLGDAPFLHTRRAGSHGRPTEKSDSQCWETLRLLCCQWALSPLHCGTSLQARRPCLVCLCMLTVTVLRRHILSGGASITGLAHKSSFETGQSAPSAASAPREHSADVQYQGMQQVWQEQSSSPQEVPDLELPRKRLLLRRRVAARLLGLWMMWFRVRLCVASEVPFMSGGTWPAAPVIG